MRRSATRASERRASLNALLLMNNRHGTTRHNPVRPDSPRQRPVMAVLIKQPRPSQQKAECEKYDLQSTQRQRSGTAAEDGCEPQKARMPTSKARKRKRAAAVACTDWLGFVIA